MALTVGSRLGHYDVTALIGAGGMGQVYQATDTKLNRQVALKILPEAFATDPDRLARFQREAQVLASLNHPNIAAIHGLEESEGTRALVLELVEGPTLADRIAQGPIPVDEALPIAKQLAEALEAAHEAGVIHRDLKPANIKVKEDGMVKVLDFGLAKAFEPEAGSASASMSPTISLTAAATQMGMIIGTAAYMAPEQAKGKRVDKRADVWAYGAVLYEWVLFTFRPSSAASWDLAQVVVQSLVTGERVVLIDGGREGRYLSTGHLVYGLDNELLAVPFNVGTHEVSGRSVPLVEGVSHPPTTVFGAAHFSVSATGSLVYVPGAVGATDVVSLVWVDRDGDEEIILAPPRAYNHPRVSPDGTRVAVAIDDGDNTDLWIWDLARETLTELTFDEAIDEYPLWTPDSARVVFRSERDGGGLFWKAADGTGQVEQLLENRNIPRPHAWVTDGRLIFDQREGVRAGIGVLTMEGERTVEWLIDSESFETQPALSPDGRWLAYISDETDTFLIYVKPFPNVDDDPWRVSPFFGRTPAWSADGSELFYFGQTDLMVAQIDTELTFRSRTPETLLSFIQRGYKRPGEGTTGRQFDLEPGGDRFIVLKSRATADEADRFNGLIFVENWFTELKERVPVN